jgi:hypothetical protein
LEKAQKDVKNISALVLRHVTLDAAVTAALLNLVESRDDWETMSSDACRGANLSSMLSTILTTRFSVKSLGLIQPSIGNKYVDSTCKKKWRQREARLA